MVVLSWKSYLIRDEGVTTFDDYIASHFERANEHEEGIVFNPWKSGPYPTWGMPALKASKAAALQGNEKWRRFHLALMKAFYTEGRDISKNEILEEVARENELLIPAFIEECRNPKWEDLVYEETRRGREVFGIRSIPAVVVEGNVLVEGTVSIDQYKQVIAEVQKKGVRIQNKRHRPS
jgi:predicted DsbA family dithiol-disulfide isomerase